MVGQALTRLRSFFCHPAVPKGIGWAVVSAGVVALIVWQLKQGFKNSAPAGQVSDSSVVIGTFITLYGLFIGAFGVLAGFVAKRGKAGDCLETFRVMAIAFLAGGTVLDLFRVLDSAGDLYTAAKTKLSFRTLNDIVYDFKVYFVINVLVGVFSVLVACLLARRVTTGRPFDKQSTPSAPGNTACTDNYVDGRRQHRQNPDVVP